VVACLFAQNRFPLLRDMLYPGRLACIGRAAPHLNARPAAVIGGARAFSPFILAKISPPEAQASHLPQRWGIPAPISDALVNLHLVNLQGIDFSN
jgi:hypothetical protein